jgi:hypothetical protein
MIGNNQVPHMNGIKGSEIKSDFHYLSD